MKILFKKLYSRKVEIKKLKKEHSGGCLIYCLAMLFEEKPEVISKKLGKPIDYWFSEDEMYEIEKVFPVKVERYEKNKTKFYLNSLPIIFCLNEHCYVCYGYSEKSKIFYFYDPNGFSKRFKEKELKDSIVILPFQRIRET